MRTGFAVHHDNAAHPVYTTDHTHNRCVSFWTAVRRWHVEHNGWPDIAYSFGVCRHGDVFTGRGWTQPQFAGGSDQKGTGYRDADWYSVLCFLGGDETPTADMYAGLTWVIEQGRDAGRCGDRVIPHNRFRIKPCPGPELTAWCEWADGNPDLGDDDMTPEDRRLLQDIHFAWVGARRLSGADGPDTVHDLATPVLNANHWASIELPRQHAELEAAMPTALDVEQLAEAIVSRLPQQAGGTVVAGPSLEQVKQALLEVLRR